MKGEAGDAGIDEYEQLLRVKNLSKPDDQLELTEKVKIIFRSIYTFLLSCVSRVRVI